MKRALQLGLFLVASCGWPKPSPDEKCRVPCIDAIESVDVYRLDGKTCTCYRAANDSIGDPGAFVQIPAP